MDNSIQPNTGVIILAAGKSSRLGKAKQLLEFDGLKLLQITINACKKSNVNQIVTVLGANYQEIKSNIDFDSTLIVYNDQWESGMASSMQAGLKKLAINHNTNQVIILLCDQPYVSHELINAMINTQKISKKNIIACKYSNTVGVPVLFTKQYFEKLLHSIESEGAKKLIYENFEDCEVIDFEQGSIDIDTIEDYRKLISKKT